MKQQTLELCRTKPRYFIGQDFLEVLEALPEDHPIWEKLLATAKEQDSYADYRGAAEDKFCDDEDLNIDADAIVSIADEHAWVQAWVMVTNGEAGIEEESDNICKFCQSNIDAKDINTAHIHQGSYVCDDCWDERLRATE